MTVLNIAWHVFVKRLNLQESLYACIVVGIV